MKVSIVVPVRDEEHSIRELLDSLLTQTRPPDQIVITDGGSVDATPQIIENYIRKGAPVRLLRAGPALPGRGRNLGAAGAFRMAGLHRRRYSSRQRLARNTRRARRSRTNRST